MAKKNVSSVKRKIKKPMNGIRKKKPNVKNVKAKEKYQVDYKSMNVDDFIENEIDRSSDEENENENDDDDQVNSFNPFPKDSKNDFESDKEDVDDMNDDASGSDNEFESHKESLAKLKEIDPEFYKFLEENDKKLLEFNDSEDEADSGDEADKLHKPSEEELEVASDESDFEPDEEDQKNTNNKKITLKLLKQWQQDIHTDKTAKTLNCLIKAFNAALVRVSKPENTVSDYIVDGSSVFNGVIQLCVLEIGPALRRYLKLAPGSKQPPHKVKRFVKIRTMVRGYFLDLLKLLGGVTSTNIINVLLKHLHYMSPFIVSFPGVTRKMLKKVIRLWGTAEETVRVVAFMCILRITNNQPATYLDLVIKSMYMTYVTNSKFMSVNTLPEINFMRRSLTEMLTLDVNVAYQHVFLYIRQLAIHLRSAVTMHKKENIQAVYNWQFVNSIHLWANLLTVTCNKPQLQPLIYPLVQVAIGMIKLLPTAQYYPLRFHVLDIFIQLSRDTSIFIPILPFLLEVLATFDFNKKHKKVSMKPIQFTCILRVSKSQMMENGFKDAIIDSIYDLLVEYLASCSHSISFPDLTLFAVLQIKEFLKKCSVVNYTKKFKQLLEKIQQNSKFIENERKKVAFNITDLKQIDAWEATIKNKGTPMGVFYESWKKIHSVKKRKQETRNEELADYALPQLKKIKKSKEKSDGPVELFPSDSEDEHEHEHDNILIKEETDHKTKTKTKTMKKENNKHKSKVKTPKVQVNANASNDIVEDLKLSDW